MAQVPDPIVRWAQPDHPLVWRFAIEFLDRDVGHCRGWRRFMPVLFDWGKRQDIPGRISSTGPPQRCARPKPEITISV